MTVWQNWSGRHRASPERLAFVRSADDAAAVVADARERGQQVRVAGAGHSHQPLVTSDGVIVDTSGLAGLVCVDREKRQAWIRAGSSIFSLGAALHAEGLALQNQGDIDRQLLAGAVSTGTHGTGRQLQNLSSSVVGVKIITAAGDLLTCSTEENPDLFEVARLSLGAVGLITEINMQLRDTCILKEAGFIDSYANLRPRIGELTVENERFEFFWYPRTDRAMVKVINETDGEPRYPLGEEGTRQAYSFEVLPSHRPHLHTEMEYSLPMANGPACFDEIAKLLKADFPEVAWPVEYRTVAADDIWLSMASGQATVTISIHQDVNLDETGYYRAAEKIFQRYGGRPHWGKVSYLTGAALQALYPQWDLWWQVRNRYDPNGVFLNDYLRSIAPDERGKEER